MGPLRTPGPLLLLAATAASLLFPCSAAPQQETPLAPGIQRERVNLILIDVVVTDRQGRSVRDLRPEEFSLRVDGHPHPIHSVELRWVGQAPPETSARPAPAEGGPPATAPSYSARSPRRFVFFFDGLDSEQQLNLRAVRAVKTFLQEGLQSGDEIMVVGQRRDFKIYLEFTPDRAEAAAALDRVADDPEMRQAGENRVRQNFRDLQRLEQDEGESHPREDGIARAIGRAREIEAKIQQAAQIFADEDRRRIQRTLASVRALVASLNATPGRKDVFFLSDGFPMDPDALYGAPGDPHLKALAEQPIPDREKGNDAYMEPQDQTRLDLDILQLVREAGSAQVAIHTVNTQGVTQGSTAMLKGVSGRSVEELVENTASATLANLSLGTGGLAFRGSNDFLPALERVGRESLATYVLSYVPEGDPDGRFHSTKVEVTRRGARVRAKEGFVWLTEGQVQERQIFSAYVSPELYHDFPVALETLAFLREEGGTAVEFAVAVPRPMLLFLPVGQEFLARLEVGLALRLGKSQVPDRFSRAVEVRLERREMASLDHLTLVARRELAPGEYQAVVVVRDLGTGNLGALRGRVQVPNLAAGRITMSSLVLEGGEGEGKRVDIDPATTGDANLVVPVVHRLFPRDGRIQASCLIYHPQRKEETGEAVIEVGGSVRKGEERVKGFAPAVHVFQAGQPARAIPLKIPISLEGLQPGVYTLEIEVMDLVGRHGVSQSLDFMVR